MAKREPDRKTEYLFRGILSLKTMEECRAFFDDICTITELIDMSNRLTAAKMLSDEATYTDVIEKTGLSTATISRVNRSLNYGNDGYDLVFSRIEQKKDESK